MSVFTLSERLAHFGDLSENSKQFLDALNPVQRSLEARAEIAVGVEADGHMGLVQSGWVGDHDLTPDGRRGILTIALPGDCLACPVETRPPQYRQTLTEATITHYPMKPIMERMRVDSGLAFAFLRLAAHQQARLSDRLLPLIQYRSYEKVAYFFLDTSTRLEAVGLARPDVFPMPLNQATIADHLGMHEVHVNRILRRMGQEGYIARERGYVRLLDRQTLADMVGYSPLTPPAGEPVR